MKQPAGNAKIMGPPTITWRSAFSKAWSTQIQRQHGTQRDSNGPVELPGSALLKPDGGLQTRCDQCWTNVWKNIAKYPMWSNYIKFSSPKYLSQDRLDFTHANHSQKNVIGCSCHSNSSLLGGGDREPLLLPRLANRCCLRGGEGDLGCKMCFSGSIQSPQTHWLKGLGRTIIWPQPRAVGPEKLTGSKGAF